MYVPADAPPSRPEVGEGQYGHCGAPRMHMRAASAWHEICSMAVAPNHINTIKMAAPSPCSAVSTSRYLVKRGAGWGWGWGWGGWGYN